MAHRLSRPLIAYPTAVAAVGLAVGLKFAAAPAGAAPAPFLLFLGAVMFAAWLGGVGPGLVATAVAVAAADYWFVAPYGRLGLAPADGRRTAQFVAEGAFISVLSGLRRRDRDQAYRRMEELRVTLRSIGDGVLTTGPDGRVTFLNPAAERLTGWAAADAVGRPAADVLRLVDEHTRGRLDCPCRRVLRGGRSGGPVGRGVLVTRAGADRPVDESAAPIRGRDGRLVGVVVVLRDTADRRRADAARADTLRRTTAILEGIGDAFYALDRGWRFTYLNRHALDYFGRPAADLLGRPLWEVLPHAVGSAFETAFRAAVAAGRAARFDARSAASGRWLGVDAYPTDDGLAVYFRDITARKQADDSRAELLDRLAVERARLRAVLDQMPAGVAVADAPDGKVGLANPPLRALLGGPGHRPAGRADYLACWPLAHADGRPVAAADFPLARALAGQTVRAAEFRRPGPAGKAVWLRASAAPVRAADGAVASAVLVVDDVTRQRETELSRLAAIAEDERRRLSRELHDETSQQMAALMLGLRAARDRGPPGGPEARPLEALQAQADAVGRSLHRIAWELRPAALDALGLEAALRGAADRWADRAGLAAEFYSALGPGRLPPDVETHVYRMVSEALANAAKHAAARRLGVILERRPGELTAIVEDNGRGFDPDAVAARADGRPRLGLAGLRERAALVGGTVEVESAPGRGTTVFVRVPLPDPGGDGP